MNNISNLLGKSVTQRLLDKLISYYDSLSSDEQLFFDSLKSYVLDNKKSIISGDAIRLTLLLKDKYDLNTFPYIRRVAVRGSNSQTGEHVIFDIPLLNGTYTNGCLPSGSIINSYCTLSDILKNGVYLDIDSPYYIGKYTLWSN